MKVLAIREALQSGRAERVPPRKSALAYPRAFHPEAIPAPVTNPAEGRAPHARKESPGPIEEYPHWAAGHLPYRLPLWGTLGVRRW
jgi:hypothetical protein